MGSRDAEMHGTAERHVRRAKIRSLWARLQLLGRLQCREGTIGGHSETQQVAAEPSRRRSPVLHATKDSGPGGHPPWWPQRDTNPFVQPNSWSFLPAGLGIGSSGLLE